MKRVNMSALKAQSGISLGNNDGEVGEGNTTGFIADRHKLKTSFNFKQFVATREGEFEVDVNQTKDFAFPDPPKPKYSKNGKLKNAKKILNGCDFKNIMVEAVTDDNDEVLMFSDFSSFRSTMLPITPDGGVKKKVDKAGQRGKLPPANAKVWIYYTAICEHWDEAVDRTDRNRQPKAFKIGYGEVLPALEIGVTTMELKEVAKFLSTPKYAYGELGLPDRVPPNATILFTVELVDFLETTQISSVFKMSPEERELIGYMDLEKAALELKSDGNRLCKERNWESASAKYRRAVKLIDRYVTLDKVADKSRNDLLFILYTNIAQCYLHIEENNKVVEVCQLALDLPPGTDGNKCKAYYRQAKAQFNLGRFGEAKRLCRQAMKLEPSNSEVRVFYDELCKRVEQDEAAEKLLSKKMCSGMKLK